MTVRELMIAAYIVATESHDPSTQNGSILAWHGEIIATGFNHVPDLKGARLKEVLNDRALKYPRVIHAEVDAIAKCAALGIRTRDLILVAPWAACLNCAAVLMQAKVQKIIVHGPRMKKGHPLGWVPQVDEALIRLQEAGIPIEVFNDPLPEAPMIRVAEELWQP